VSSFLTAHQHNNDDDNNNEVFIQLMMNTKVGCHK